MGLGFDFDRHESLLITDHANQQMRMLRWGSISSPSLELRMRDVSVFLVFHFCWIKLRVASCDS